MIAAGAVELTVIVLGADGAGKLVGASLGVALGMASCTKFSSRQAVVVNMPKTRPLPSPCSKPRLISSARVVTVVACCPM